MLEQKYLANDIEEVFVMNNFLISRVYLLFIYYNYALYPIAHRHYSIIVIHQSFIAVSN